MKSDEFICFEIKINWIWLKYDWITVENGITKNKMTKDKMS